MDYRIVVRQFEFERMLAPQNTDRETFGARYADQLLERIFETNAEKLEELFPRFREELGTDEEERRVRAKSIAAAYFPTIKRAYRKPSRATFVEESPPKLSLDGKGWLRSTPPPCLAYYENKHDMEWGIAQWNGIPATGKSE